MIRRLAALALALAAVLAVGMSGLAPVHATPTTGPASPHGRPDGCVACHATTDGSGPPRPEAETCLGCHPDGDPHPWNVVPRGVTVPAGWPMVDGKVTCATCHAEASCAPGRSPEPPFLRGGNVTRAGDFCARCHTGAALARANPHAPARPGDPADPTCAACHSGTPSAGARPEDAHLRVAPEATCRTCHPGEVHAGVSAHLGATPGRDGVAPPLSASALPLTAAGAIACWTCHDVHGGHGTATAGRRSAAADAIRALALGAPAPAVHGDAPHPPSLLALNEAQLCAACHGAGP